jgi:tetratricopeptide (TPR) repeat protein
MKKVFLFFLASCIIFSSVAVHAQQGLTPENILSFADHLFDEGDYYRAITEYERFLFSFPRHPLVKKAEHQIAMSYFKGEKYSQALERFRTLAERYPSDETGIKSLFMLAETYYQKKDYNQAIDAFEKFLTSYPKDPQADAAKIKKGWCYLRQGNWREASEEFRKLPPDSPLHAQGQELAEESGKYPGIEKKSPYLAGGLSAVLPGAGQLYIGRKTDAAAAFLLNGTFIWAATESYRKRSYVTTGILLFFESGWYLGNIYNAISSAHKYNRLSEAKFMENLQGRYGISLFRDDQGGNMLAFTMRF